jgi:putative acetyltransferase
MKTVTTEASEFSKPLFEKHGFTVTEVEHTTCKGVEFTRYAMRLELARP